MTAQLLLPLVDPVPSPSEVKPGWIALLIVVLLGVAVVLLWLSMRKQISKVHFDEDATSTRRRSTGPHR
jgi:hypothetical protein